MAQTCEAKEKTGKAAIKAGYATIADIARDRIKRLLNLDGFEGKQGFRAFAIAASHTLPWTGVADKTADAFGHQLEAFADTLAPGWKAEDVVWEVAIREGFSLTASIEKLAKPKGAFWRVTDPDKEQSFTISLDDKLTLDTVRALNLGKDDLFVCRDTALDDTLAANLALQCRLKVL